MNTFTLSREALSVIDHYFHIQIGNAVCTTPYFNNKTTKRKAAPRALVGKGSPREITEEAQTILIKHHIDPTTLADASLKKLLTDHKIGIDCSGFAYHILDAEHRTRHHDALHKRLISQHTTGIFGKIRFLVRPIENSSVAVFADNAHSTIIPLDRVAPGDIITFETKIENSSSRDTIRDHILVIDRVRHTEDGPTHIHYSHAIAYPTDGPYDTGVRQGEIEVTNSNLPLTRQRWIEHGREGENNPLFIRAQHSTVHLRRLNWF